MHSHDHANKRSPKEIVPSFGSPSQLVDAELAQTLDKAEDARFWAGVRADYARLQADPREWRDYVSELAEWDHTAGDGLGDE